MNHPTREQWIDYLYKELPSAELAELKSHAASCAECDAQLASWRDVGAKLDTWEMAAPRSRPVAHRNAVKWGIAAMLLIGFGFGLARFTAPTFDSVQLEKTLRAEFQQQLAAVRADQNVQFASLLAELKTQRATDYAALRADLDTVAVTAEATLRRTQRQIGQLSLIARNENNSSPEIQ